MQNNYETYDKCIQFIIDNKNLKEKDLMEEVSKIVPKSSKFSGRNKGTGAGGSNTNKNGLGFEEKTKFNTDGFNKIIIGKNEYYENGDIIYCRQNAFQKVMSKLYGYKPEEMTRNPDEAYINKKTKTIKIMEIKHQNVEGSVDEKLWAGSSRKREYEIIFKDFKIEYAYCLSSYFESKFNDNLKFKILNKILDESNIKYFFGQLENYNELRNIWIYE